MLEEINAQYGVELRGFHLRATRPREICSLASGRLYTSGAIICEFRNRFSQFLPKDLTGSSELDPFSYHFTV